MKMSKGFKVVLVVFAVVVVVCGIVYFALGDTKDTSKKDNDTTETKKKEPKKELDSKIPNGFSMENEKITIQNGVLNLDVTVINNSEKKVKLKNVNVIIKDKDKNVISDLTIAINTDLESREGIQISSQDMVSYEGELSDTIYRFETE